MDSTNRFQHDRSSALVGWATLVVLAALALSLLHVATAPSVDHGDCVVCIAMHSAVVSAASAATVSFGLVVALRVGLPTRFAQRSLIACRGRAPPFSLFV